MTEIVADLHMHSTHSDGLYTPRELYEEVVKKGLKAFSITDHDSVAGYRSLAETGGIVLIPGVELTSTLDNREIHLLGYFFNPEHPELLETLAKISKKRRERLIEIVEMLNEEGKVWIDIDELTAEWGNGSYSRLNLARFMVRKKLVSGIENCFAQFLGESSSVYRPVNYFSPKEAIRLIHSSGGLAFLAHPYTANVEGQVPELVEHGLNGIEAYHPSHGPGEVKGCLEWAVRFNLGVSGGSDFHGNSNSQRQLLSSGLTGERLVDFLALKPNQNFIAA